MARIIVCGYMIRYPLSGMLFAYFHYVLGLRRLGHEVFYLEESGWPGSCYDPVARDHGDDPARGLDAVRALMSEHEIDVPIAYVNRDSGAVFGAEWEDVKRSLASCDLLLDIGGVCWLPEFRLARRRALIDLDPFFTQVGRFANESLEEHHVHFTYGVNIGSPGSTIPTRGIDWRPTVPPVVPEVWQGQRGAGDAAAGQAGDAPFTTVANWSAYGGITHAGKRYGQKDEEFLRLVDLPRHARQRLEIAISGGDRHVRERLSSAGWLLRDAGEVSSSTPVYKDYIARSRGEFSVAKNAYVETRSGWFSDRSVCYLAAGRPVVLQDTGFTDWLPPRPGVLAFSGLDEAVAALERADVDHALHSSGARQLAEETFGYRVVLPRLVESALKDGRAPESPFDREGGP